MSLFTYPWECPGLHFFTLFATKTWNDFSMEISLVDFWTMPCRQGRQFISALRFLPFFSHFFSLAAQGSRPPFFDYDCASLRPRRPWIYAFLPKVAPEIKKNRLGHWWIGTRFTRRHVWEQSLVWGEMVRMFVLRCKGVFKRLKQARGKDWADFRFKKLISIQHREFVAFGGAKFFQPSV